MKKAIQLGISAFAAATLLYGCSDEWGVNGSGATGRIAPMVGIDTEAVSSRAAASQSRVEAEDITASDLSLTLSKTDGSYAETWTSIGDFPLEKEFSVGAYNLEVYYGDPKEEGFGLPAYAGSTTLTVVDGQTTELGLTASLANCRFIINYTEAFTGYMADWSATVQGAGDAIAYAKDETRPVYVQPGDVKIVVSVTKPNGMKASFSLPTVKAQARYEYTVNVDVNGGQVGDALLSVTFDENLKQEDIELDISDAVLSAPLPTAEAEGFTSGVAIEVVAGLPTDLSLSMNLIAQAKLGEVLLETSSESLLRQGWPASIDLLKADAAAQGTLTALGFKALGLWNRPDQMAVLDFSEVVKNIKAVAGDNTTRFTLTLKDALLRAADPVELVLSVEGVRLELASAGQFFSPGDPLDVKLGFNGGATAVKEGVQFFCFDPDAGKFRQAQVLAVSEPTSRAMNDYTVTIATPTFEGDLRVYAVCGDVRSEELTIGMAPFEIAGSDNDVYATHAYLSVIGTDGNPTPDINSAKWLLKKDGDAEYTEAAVSIESGYAKIAGLTPDTEYLVKVEVDGARSKAFGITTEKSLAVPNGDFEELVETMSKTDMPESGQWSISRGINYQNTLSYTVSEPTGWTSVNAKTASSAAANQNSWFVVPSTFNTSGKYVGQYPTVMTYARNEGTPSSYSGFAAQSGSNAMVVRNVAWDAAGTTPGVWYKMFATEHWNHTVPTVADRSAGKLFLGSYSYANGTEQYNEGVAFSSRPSSLKGYYRYIRGSQDSSEQGVVTISLMNGNTVVATTTVTLDAASDFTEFEAPLTYKPGATPKASSLRIMIASSTHASYNQAEETANIKTDNKLNTFEAYSLGATLVIDNLTFNY